MFLDPEKTIEVFDDRKPIESGMAYVYEGRIHPHGAPVMAKRLKREMLSEKWRFLLEAELMVKAREASEAIPIIYRILDENSDEPTLIIELIRGPRLDECWSGISDPVERLRILRAVAAELEKIHRVVGIYHRDIKPEHIMFKEGEDAPKLAEAPLKLIDFGIGKDRTSTPTTSFYTGQILGTPEYIAPEQVDPDLAQPNQEHLIDVYQLGTLAFEWFTGLLPFGSKKDASATTPDAIMRAKVASDPPDPEKLAQEELGVEIHPEISKLILRMIARRPADRMQSMGETCREIDRIIGLLTDAPAANRTRSTAPLVAGAAIAAALAVFWLDPFGWRAPRSDPAPHTAGLATLPGPTDTPDQPEEDPASGATNENPETPNTDNGTESSPEQPPDNPETERQPEGRTPLAAISESERASLAALEGLLAESRTSIESFQFADAERRLGEATLPTEIGTTALTSLSRDVRAVRESFYLWLNAAINSAEAIDIPARSGRVRARILSSDLDGLVVMTQAAGQQRLNWKDLDLAGIVGASGRSEADRLKWLVADPAGGFGILIGADGPSYLATCALSCGIEWAAQVLLTPPYEMEPAGSLLVARRHADVRELIDVRPELGEKLQELERDYEAIKLVREGKLDDALSGYPETRAFAAAAQEVRKAARAETRDLLDDPNLYDKWREATQQGTGSTPARILSEKGKSIRAIHAGGRAWVWLPVRDVQYVDFNLRYVLNEVGSKIIVCLSGEPPQPPAEGARLVIDRTQGVQGWIWDTENQAWEVASKRPLDLAWAGEQHLEIAWTRPYVLAFLDGQLVGAVRNREFTPQAVAIAIERGELEIKQAQGRARTLE